ncbi:GTP cyclohydrolase II RibA [Chryseobacterium taklimakanense]|uniref:GTP cyclohydrolase II RibA n=1 Tax=Chryseobacterium taklimakanense TaxID=536441 RepID=UPI00293E2B85|nr:GTP cyclohydrolase II RibA [Chryseobacterium taklimakanense]
MSYEKLEELAEIALAKFNDNEKTDFSLKDKAAFIQYSGDDARKLINSVELVLNQFKNSKKERNFTLAAFKEKNTGNEHMALIKGEWEEGEPVLTRVHSSCFTGDILGSLRCDCGDPFHAAMEQVEREGKGIVLYMNQEGRGIGLFNKLHAYKLQEEGLDTVDANLQLGFKADERDYGVGAQILRQLGATKLRLMSNNPRKRAGLFGYGIETLQIVPVEVCPTPTTKSTWPPNAISWGITS